RRCGDRRDPPPPDSRDADGRADRDRPLARHRGGRGRPLPPASGADRAGRGADPRAPDPRRRAAGGERGDRGGPRRGAEAGRRPRRGGSRRERRRDRHAQHRPPHGLRPDRGTPEGAGDRPGDPRRAEAELRAHGLPLDHAHRRRQHDLADAAHRRTDPRRSSRLRVRSPQHGGAALGAWGPVPAVRDRGPGRPAHRGRNRRAGGLEGPPADAPADRRLGRARAMGSLPGLGGREGAGPEGDRAPHGPLPGALPRGGGPEGGVGRAGRRRRHPPRRPVAHPVRASQDAGADRWGDEEARRAPQGGGRAEGARPRPPHLRRRRARLIGTNRGSLRTAPMEPPSEGLRMTRAMLLALAALSALPLVSCARRVVVVEHDVAYSYGPREEMVVSEPPPAPQKEVIPAAPSANHVWVSGYWTHAYNGWV